MEDVYKTTNVEVTHIEVLDAIMGSGKSSSIIQWMKQHPENKYLFVSPLLSEVQERIPVEASELEFVFPNTETFSTKRQHLKHLLQQGRNICFTHALYSDMDKECLSLIKGHGYTLILDEEVNFIQAVEGYTRSDLKSLFEANHILIDEDDLGRVTWNWEISEGHKYYKLKSLCDIGCVYSCKRDNETVTVHLPTELLSSCKRVILLTYGFTGGVLERFLSLKGVKISPFTEIDLSQREGQIKSSIRNRIHLIETPTTKQVSKYSMSWNWWMSDSTLEQRKLVLKAIRTVPKSRGILANKDDFMYTLPKDVAKRLNHKITGLPFEDCFVSRSTRATNIYQHKWCLVHAYNRRPNMAVKMYLQDYLHDTDDESFALYELLQWIWRSKIRTPDGEIYLCIIPKRMKELFNNWLNNL